MMIRTLIDYYRKIKSRQFYAHLIRRGNLCFDIGANVGLKSKLFLEVGAKVIAFEPQSSCLKQLAEIRNPNFHFLAFAVGAHNETRKLYLSNHSEVATLSEKFIQEYTSPSVYWNNSEKVVVKSLDYLITEYGLPDFCKIDVEGYELKILGSLSYKIPMLEFEFTGKLFNDTEKIIHLLNDEGYLFNYTLNEQPKFMLCHWVDGHQIIEQLRKLSKEKLHGNLFCKLQYHDSKR